MVFQWLTIAYGLVVCHAVGVMARARGTSGRELSASEWRDFVDREAHTHLGMSAEEFEQRWNAGEFKGEQACPEAMHVGMLLPLAR